ncbi:MAG TPA: hypothetical protein VN698_15620 [Bacteroidia bacterium]|nr:hypothetical protein [Bacteroidia bacterium]
MAITTQCCYLGVGNVYMVDYNNFNNKVNSYINVGNTVAATITTDNTTLGNIINKQTIARGLECSKPFINAISIEFQLSCHKLDNLKTALFASSATTAAGAQTETYAVNKGEYFRLLRIPAATNPTIVVKGASGTPTYVAGTDYIIMDTSTIYIPPTSTIPNPTITAGVGANNIQVTYNSQSTTSLDLFVNPPGDYRIFLSAQNLLGDTSAVDQNQNYVEIYRASLTLTGNFELIASGDDANIITVTATLKPDSKNNFKYGTWVGAT